MNKVKLFFKGVGEALKDEFGISGAKNLSKQETDNRIIGVLRELKDNH